MGNEDENEKIKKDIIRGYDEYFNSILKRNKEIADLMSAPAKSFMADFQKYAEDLNKQMLKSLIPIVETEKKINENVSKIFPNFPKITIPKTYTTSFDVKHIRPKEEIYFEEIMKRMDMLIEINRELMMLLVRHIIEERNKSGQRFE